MIKVDHGIVTSEGDVAMLMIDATIALLHAWSAACRELGADIAEQLLDTACENVKNPTIRAEVRSARIEQEEEER